MVHNQRTLVPILGILILSLISCPSSAQIGDLLWEDNFNTGSLNLENWSYETGTGVNGDWGTGQLDRATDREENVSFQNDVTGAEDGCLVITTRKEFYINRDYTSGRIISKGKSSWGPGHRIVARVQPRDVRHPGQGFAFWMMPDEIPDGYSYIMWPQGGEVDIMEYVGSIPYNNLASVHYAWSWENNQWQSWNHNHQGFYYNYETQGVPNPSEPGYGGYPAETDDPNAGIAGFHTYGIDWYYNRMEFFVDDNVYHIHYFNDGSYFSDDGQNQEVIEEIEGSRTGISEYSHHFDEWKPFEHKMFMILSAGVGGADHTYGGPIVPEAEFPCSVFIDWVRVYELEDTGLVLGSEESPIESAFLYPNPANGFVKVRIKSPTNPRVIIHDQRGKLMLDAILDSTLKLDVSSLNHGVYLVTLLNGHVSMSQKLIIH